MVKRTVQCSCQTQLNVQIRIFKRDYCSVHTNETSDNEMSFEIKHTVKHKFLAQIGKVFSILSVKPIYPNAY